MQNRYVGDFGDFVKLAMLRALAVNRRLGVAWWLYPDETHNADGKHISYLNDPGKWAHLDPELFAGLQKIVSAENRHISLLEESGLLPGALFANDVLCVKGKPHELALARKAWFAKTQNALAAADLIFVDPDNGIETARFSKRSAKAGKSVSYEELRMLADGGRSLIVYHHQTRRKGGHLREIDYLSGEFLKNGFHGIGALRASNYSPRVFFILNGDNDLLERAARLANRWPGSLSWHYSK